MIIIIEIIRFHKNNILLFLALVSNLHVLQSMHPEAHHETITQMDKMPFVSHEMHGMYGTYPMSREISGTDWQPDSTPRLGQHAQKKNWTFMTMDFLNVAFTHQSGPRGGNQVYNTSMFMNTAQRDICDKWTLAFRTMFSLDALDGPKGYRLLLQTGETANGVDPLIDRQHPHDFFTELAVVLTRIFENNNSFFIYFGLPGEPALGPPIYMMRYSGTYNPEAPISHHWLDSTHIQFGVFTLGYVFNPLKVEWSIFSGREPDQHRWDIEKPSFDSYSMRVSCNPTKNIALQWSVGFLKSPEQLEPETDITRMTASLLYNFKIRSLNCQLMGAWGRNKYKPGHASNAFLFEIATNICDKHIFFSRAEEVDKNELFAPPDPRAGTFFNVGRFTLGYIYQIANWHHVQIGIGALGAAIFVPQRLDDAYGKNPVSGTIFLQLRVI